MPVENSVFSDTKRIKLFITNHYGMEPHCIETINGSSANCYKIVCENEAFFLKEFQSKFNKPALEREIRICQKLEQYGIPTSEFIKALCGEYVLEENGHLFHLQKYIDGRTLERNGFKKSLLLESAELLGKIHLCLDDLDFLPAGFPDEWFDNWKLSNSLAKHISIMNDVELSDMNDALKQELLKACKTKIDLLNKFNIDYSKYKKFLKLNSHGDYNNLQIICEKNRLACRKSEPCRHQPTPIKAIIDFSSAAQIPAVWELIRSYTYSAEECKNGDDINLNYLKAYLDAYLKYRELPLFDISNMAGFYYYNLLRSSYGLNSKAEKTIQFAIWRTNLCKYLSKFYKEIDMFLYEQYKGRLS